MRLIRRLIPQSVKRLVHTVVGPVDEVTMVHSVLRRTRRAGVMIDVGAHHGGTLAWFAEDGWRVYAFEPDPDNRRALEARFGTRAGITIDPRAVSDQIRSAVPFFTSPTSTGISSLSAFESKHHASHVVDTVTLDVVVKSNSITQVDLLKVDAEGHDLFVLRGFPWRSVTPRAIVCEFEDRKTVPLGYSVVDMLDFLLGLGYHVLVSEWHPIRIYGTQHEWRRFTAPTDSTLNRSGWGNLIAMHSLEDFRRLRTIAAAVALGAKAKAWASHVSAGADRGC